MEDKIKGRKIKELLAASLKSKDTEEWLDVHFTRPIGLAFALLWHKLGVAPNYITVLSMFLGVAAGVMFYFTDFLHNLFGVMLLMLANFCDSTDGQLARLTNQKSMIGRCLDGFAGDVWFFAIYLAIVLRIWNQNMPGTSEPWGFYGLALAAIAGIVSHMQQSSLSDYYRQIHLYFLKGDEGSELDTYEVQRAELEKLKGKEGVFWDRAFHSNYQNYCKSQEKRTPEFQKLRKTIETNFLTFNSRAIFIYITCLLNIPWVYFLLEITLYNIIYIYMHKRHEELCEKIRLKL